MRTGRPPLSPQQRRDRRVLTVPMNESERALLDAVAQGRPRSVVIRELIAAAAKKGK